MKYIGEGDRDLIVLAAHFLDIRTFLRQLEVTAESAGKTTQARLARIALTELHNAAMWGVEALTCKEE